MPLELKAAGADVTVAPVYRTIRPETDTSRVRTLLAEGCVDAVTFTSSSTVSNFIGMFGDDEPLLVEWMNRTAVACIGPVTADTARRLGLHVTFTADPYTMESLCSALVSHFAV